MQPWEQVSGKIAAKVNPEFVWSNVSFSFIHLPEKLCFFVVQICLQLCIHYYKYYIVYILINKDCLFCISRAQKEQKYPMQLMCMWMEQLGRWWYWSFHLWNFLFWFPPNSASYADAILSWLHNVPPPPTSTETNSIFLSPCSFRSAGDHAEFTLKRVIRS